MREISFLSGGVECAAWHLTATSDALAGEHGRPCVVMAHGFGGTRDTALLPYAERFAAAGLDVVLFDYCGFGASAGTLRQSVSYRRQRADYRAAIAAARSLEGVDPERIVLWGTSYAGGHVVAVAAGDPGVAAVIALTPAMDGVAAVAAIVRHGGPRRLAILVGNGLRDALRAATGRKPYLVEIAGPPGSSAIIAKDGARAAYSGIAGPTWRNEVCARASLGVVFNRPIRFAGRLSCPLLIQVGDADTVAPPSAALAAAKRAGDRAELHRYPVDHFDVYDGPWQHRAVTDQLHFLRRHLAGRAIHHNEKAGV